MHKASSSQDMAAEDTQDNTPSKAPTEDTRSKDVTNDAFHGSTQVNHLSKRKAVFPIQLKDPAFPVPSMSEDSEIHLKFGAFRERSKVLAEKGNIDFAVQQAEALALNGVWYVGQTPLECACAVEVQKKMRILYRIKDDISIMTLSNTISDVIADAVEEGTMEEEEEAIGVALDKLGTTDMSWKSRKVLKVWRHLMKESRPSSIDASSPFCQLPSLHGSGVQLKSNTEHQSAQEAKQGHANGVRSDYYVEILTSHLVLTCVLLIIEIKPPKKSEFLDAQDRWKIIRMMKNEIDSQIKKGVPDPVVWACQIFGYDMYIYVMNTEVKGLYCLYKTFTGMLPKSMEHTSSIGRIISALFSTAVSGEIGGIYLCHKSD
ncbi:hypothetical protein EDD11_001990 [Mortierella claussenii]|nr:hypothetical protein EDD11_001990 [Mortierella claussenii]